MAKKKKPPPRKRPGRPPARPVGDPVGPDLPTDPALQPLTADETAFVAEYLVDRNATAAYMRLNPDVSYQVAGATSHLVRNRPHVSAEIRIALRAQGRRTGINADLVLAEIKRVAFSDIYQLYDPATHQLRHPRHIPFDLRVCVSSVKVSRERRTVRTVGNTRTTVTDCLVEYKLWNKLDALEKLCKYLGLQTSISPIDALLAALPSQLALDVRRALTATTPSTNGKHK